MQRAAHAVPFNEAVRVWARVAALSFGGPAGQIAVMHRILVEEKRWIGEERFLHALNYCMLLPGPEAQQLAIYIGWLLNRTRGGLIAGILFVLPGFLAILALSYVYVLLGQLPAIEGLFFGLKAAVLAIVLQAAVRISSRALRSVPLRATAVAAFIAIFLFRLPFPLIVLGAAAVGLIGSMVAPASFRPAAHGGGAAAIHDRDTLLGETLPDHARPNLRWSLTISGAFLLLWLVPVAALILLLGPSDVFSRIAIFFSQMAVVTFGGAYAVLAYVAQAAADLLGLRFRDRIAHAIMLRLELVSGDREAVRRGATLFALPHHAADGARAIWHTADTIWTALGDESRDFAWYSKRATLSAVYSSALLYWLGDDSPGASATREFVARRIDNVMQIE